MKETQKVNVLDLPNQQERNDGIYEEFWKVRDPQVFAKKILNQRAARKYFRSEGLYKDLFCKTNESVKIDFRSKDKDRKIIIKQAKNMNIFTIFAQNDMKKLKQKQMCKYIRAIISLKKENISKEESKQIWMQCSGSLDMNRQNQQYYKKILQQQYYDVSEHQIDQDMKRSRELVAEDSQLQAMKRIFIAYARRNACIGYCQGLNYIVAKFLRFGISEEESFWLLVQLLENILPLDYYPSMMMGVVCDQKIFEQILKVENEKVYKKLNSFEANVLNILLTQWIVCLFTQALDDSLLLVIFNHLFTKGSIIIFKVCLVLINYCEKEILKSEGLEVVKKVENKLKDWKDAKKFSSKLEKIYINEKGINFMREFYKQICLIQLKQKSMNRRYQPKQIDFSKIECNQDYPTCKHLIEKENTRDNNQPPEYFIFKSTRNFQFVWDYFQNSKNGDKRNVGINEDEDIMQTLHDHICPKKQLNNKSSIKIQEQNSEIINLQIQDQKEITIKNEQEQQQNEVIQIKQQNNNQQLQQQIQNLQKIENQNVNQSAQNQEIFLQQIENQENKIQQIQNKEINHQQIEKQQQQYDNQNENGFQKLQTENEQQNEIQQNQNILTETKQIQIVGVQNQNILTESEQIQIVNEQLKHIKLDQSVVQDYNNQSKIQNEVQINENQQTQQEHQNEQQGSTLKYKNYQPILANIDEETKVQQIESEEICDRTNKLDRSQNTSQVYSVILQEQSYDFNNTTRYNIDPCRYSSDSSVEPQLYFKKEELDNSNSIRFFSDITRQKNKFNYLINNPSKNQTNNYNFSEISKVIKEIQEEA
ncbi:TBC domain protein (macronuclear) [Tetrahymena thermophila SB210]|uniref:TBC domain protein n=1 Tax=Tetrahymena thermophila (strain SB210) TaxID=312017 RepID=Q23PV8_TETTS|nr:TBC domain protein [Tetrahymena thermophila SB210]EAR98577.2 TBC domain protein [Tetrahymena thermophila SB210]|eukprot:XP_001018822.2 TBC domain protein [Tetrahymena thermophila SB210]